MASPKTICLKLGPTLQRGGQTVYLVRLLAKSLPCLGARLRQLTTHWSGRATREAFSQLRVSVGVWPAAHRGR
jgi:hypothetical protein